MPDTIEAIPGVEDFSQVQKKAARLATEALPSLPNWIKNWTPEDVETYIDTNVTDLDSAKAVLTEVGKVLVLLRDVLKLKQEV